METLRVEYADDDGFQIVMVDEKKYYYGDGKTVNAFGISANQFLRFHPYMKYVANENVKVNENSLAWINKNKDQRRNDNALQS